MPSSRLAWPGANDLGFLVTAWVLADRLALLGVLPAWRLVALALFREPRWL